MIRKRLPGIVPGTIPDKRRVTRDPRRGSAESRSDFTILVVGFDRENFCAVIESIYVPEALNQAEAGRLAGCRGLRGANRDRGSAPLRRRRAGQSGETGSRRRGHLTSSPLPRSCR